MEHFLLNLKSTIEVLMINKIFSILVLLMITGGCLNQKRNHSGIYYLYNYGRHQRLDLFISDSLFIFYNSNSRGPFNSLTVGRVNFNKNYYTFLPPLLNSEISLYDILKDTLSTGNLYIPYNRINEISLVLNQKDTINPKDSFDNLLDSSKYLRYPFYVVHNLKNYFNDSISVKIHLLNSPWVQNLNFNWNDRKSIFLKEKHILSMPMELSDTLIVCSLGSKGPKVNNKRKKTYVNRLNRIQVKKFNYDSLLKEFFLP